MQQPLKHELILTELGFHKGDYQRRLTFLICV
jgi:hypothetical protein